MNVLEYSFGTSAANFGVCGCFACLFRIIPVRECFAGPLDTMLRALVIGRLGSCDDQVVIAEARKRFAAHVTGTCQLPADLRGPVIISPANRVYYPPFNRGILSSAKQRDIVLSLSVCPSRSFFFDFVRL